MGGWLILSQVLCIWEVCLVVSLYVIPTCTV